MIDPSVIANLKDLERDGNPGLLGDLVRLFRRRTPEAITEMEAALAAADAHRLSRAAHGLKASTGNLGAMRLMELATEIEQSARAQHLEKAASLLAVFREEFAVAADELARAAGA